MIDPHWELVDLDPFTWREIGRFFSPAQYVRAGTPDERGLFILHDDGVILSATDSQTGQRVDIASSSVVDAEAMAGSLYASGDWDRVHIIDRNHLRRVAHRAQSVDSRNLTLDEYYHQVFKLVWNDSDGYVAMPPHPGHWNFWTYGAIRNFIDQFGTPVSLALGVFGDNGLRIGLITVITDGHIRKVTTFESLPMPKTEMSMTQDFLEFLWSELGSAFQPAAAALLCTSEVFEGVVELPDKLEVLQTAVHAGDALLKVRNDPPNRGPRHG